MHILNQGQRQPDPTLALELVRFRIIGRPYHKWRAIIAAGGESSTAFLIGLQMLHGIVFDSLHGDPMLYCTEDTQQLRLFREEGVEHPNEFQLAITAKVWAINEEECKTKMEELLHKFQEPEPIPS